MHGEADHSVAVSYRIDTQSAPYRQAITDVDAATDVAAALAAIKAKKILGRQTLPIWAAFSNAGATVGVRLVGVTRDDKGKLLNAKISPAITLSATGIKDKSGGKYLSEVWAQDGYGSAEVILLVTTKPSAGSVDLWLGSI